MCIYIYIHTYLCTYIHTSLPTYVHTCIHTYIYTHRYIQIYIYIHIHILLQRATINRDWLLNASARSFMIFTRTQCTSAICVCEYETSLRLRAIKVRDRIWALPRRTETRKHAHTARWNHEHASPSLLAVISSRTSSNLVCCLAALFHTLGRSMCACLSCFSVYVLTQGHEQ